MSEVKTNTLDEQSVTEAFYQGLALTEMMALFSYFINHTPEGAVVKKEIEADWQKSCRALRENSKLRGTDFSLAKWLRQIQKLLLLDQKKVLAEEKKLKQNAAKRHGMTSLTKAKKGVKFKNITSFS
jgi:pterin-4a-carbinolamine dehydratase